MTEATALTEDQAAYVAGLMELAGWWLSENPDAIPKCSDGKFLLPLHTVAAVERFAGRHGLDVVVDDVKRIVSASTRFGPRVEFRAFCLISEDESSVRVRRRRAEAFAAEHGLKLVPVEETGEVPA